ncbi:MAG: hypothetical protein J7L47_09155 [Candidatus Odinarchaeota archaeon]|nr:hypothetical protein [Candidatus Odinarchaeota archaeon]
MADNKFNLTVEIDEETDAETLLYFSDLFFKLAMKKLGLQKGATNAKKTFDRRRSESAKVN